MLNMLFSSYLKTITNVNTVSLRGLIDDFKKFVMVIGVGGSSLKKRLEKMVNLEESRLTMFQYRI